RVLVLLRAAAIEHGCQVSATTKPGLGGVHETSIQVHRRNLRTPRMDDQRNAGRPEARVVFGARNLLAELAREFSVHGRNMHARLLEHLAAQQRHDATTTAVTA